MSSYGPLQSLTPDPDGYVQKYIGTCPSCGVRGTVDHSQYIGNVSVDCPECDYHETHDHRGNLADPQTEEESRATD